MVIVMPINGTDNYIDPERKYSDSYSEKEFLDIIESICKTYKKVLKQREKDNNYYTGFTLQDYNSNRSSEDPSYFYILEVFGNWNSVLELLPISNYHYREDNLKNDIHSLYNILKAISVELGKDIGKIGVREFNDYRNNHSDDNIPGWRSFSKNIVGNTKWKSCVKEVERYEETL